ncbi:MAG: hypothetical protein AAGF12_00975 [Myxococcota bacterium]
MKLWLLALVVVALVACDDSNSSSSDAPAGEVRPRSEPVEFVGFTVEQPVTSVEGLSEVLEPLFGVTARDGAPMTDFALQPGLFLTSLPDSRTPEQAVVQVEMEPVGGGDRRTILQAPASFGYGRVFIDTAKVATARALAVIAEDPDGMRPFLLEYRSVSRNGGVFRVQVKHENGATSLVIGTQSPETSLQPGFVNAPAFTGEPYEVLGGTVWFELTRDQFDFFSTRAYGITAGADQNFSDFQLLPHDWLRLTVTPRLEDELVDVNFDVVDLDGNRVQFARAPASLLAGDQSRENVFRAVTNMLNAEAAIPGSSTRFEVPFHYDDPEGGGVVQVIAEGQGGIFEIAYAVESPRQRLQDVAFLPYQGVLDLPDPNSLEPPDDSCAAVGSADAIEGQFRIRFDASPTVRESASLDGPLRGSFNGSIYRAEDVQLSGPIDGAVAVANIDLADVDITVPGEGMEFLIETTLPIGEYQVLGFLDIDGNADPAAPSPDVNDPVTLPIGAYTLKCAEQPIVVEFALLLPEGR